MGFANAIAEPPPTPIDDKALPVAPYVANIFFAFFAKISRATSGTLLTQLA